MRLFLWELRLLARNRAYLALLSLYMAIACMAIFAGYQRHEHQLSQHRQVETRYQQDLDKWRGGEELESGYVGYYQFVPAAAAPSPWAALFSGEQAEHNWHLRVRLLALYGQLYAGEIQHYDHWILGHFDLGFVWIYLLPVIIGLLCVNIIADEKNSGRWWLLRAQTKSAHQFLLSRLKVGFLTLMLLNTGVLLIASAALGIAIDTSLGTVLSLLIVYHVFWFSVAALIAHRERNATFNVLVYCCIWLGAALALPAMHYLSRMNSAEMNLGIAVLMEQREQMNDSWDRDKNADFAKFLEVNPQWRETSPLSEAFHWKWYYAMQNMSDAAVREQVEQLRALRSDAYRSASGWGWLSPVMSLQQSLASLAGTDGLAHQHYLDQVETLHQNLQNFFYPHYFFDEPFAVTRLAEIPTFAFQLRQSDAQRGLLQLGLVNLIMLGLFFLLSFRSLRRRTGTMAPPAPVIPATPPGQAPLQHRSSTAKAVE